MKEFKMVFSTLEEKFDNATKEICWSCSRPRNELSFLEENNVGLMLQTKGVENYIYKYGKRHNRFAPDFIILTQEELKYVKDCLERAAKIGEWKNPFDTFRPSKKQAIEIFGDYWHSEQVIKVSPKEHIEQVKKAYESIGWNVEIIWETDVKAENFSDYIKSLFNEENNSNRLVNTKEHCVYMQHPDMFRKLGEDVKKSIIDSIFTELRGNDELLVPSYFEAICDLNNLEKRVADGIFSKGIKSNIGQTVCKRFCKTLLRAKPRTENSVLELWNNDEKLKNSIYRQLNFFDGAQTVNKIKNELLNQQGYRCPSNFPPITACMIYKELGLKEGDTIFDPCAGFGGRMMASWACGINYVGVDANSELIEELKELAIFANNFKNKNKIELYHGAIEDKKTFDLVKDKKFNYVFTSPPYFDLEHYSDDKTQSDMRYKTWQEYKDGFLLGLFDVVGKLLNKEGKLVLNIPEKAHSVNFYSEIKELAVSEGWSIDYKLNLDMKSRRGCNTEVLVSFCKSKAIDTVPGFGEKNVAKNYYMPNFMEGKHYVICEKCGGRFARLSQHLRKTHSISVEDYLTEYPKSLVQSEIDSERVIVENESKERKGKYIKRLVYKCPDGKLVRKKDAWKRAWNMEEPPEDTVLNAETIDLDKWKDKVEKIDFVVCKICGFRGKSITRHVKREHNIDAYVGELKCEKAKENLHKGALLKWDRQGRKPIRDVSLNKTHKLINGKSVKDVLTKEVMKNLYCSKKLSDEKIASMYNLSGTTISQIRKMHGISAFKLKR